MGGLAQGAGWIKKELAEQGHMGGRRHFLASRFSACRVNLVASH